MTRPSPPSDLELLVTECDVLWGDQTRGRDGEQPTASVLVSRSGTALVPGPDLVAPVRSRLRGIVVDAPGGDGTERGVAPPIVNTCRGILEQAIGPIHVSGGPSYLVEPPLESSASLPVLRSGCPGDARLLRDARPDTWEAGEWTELLDGQSGPWAVLVDHDLVVAVCHTPRDAPSGVEGGIWTHPEFRGRGYAAAVTAEWANLLADRGRTLFYSTAADNRASQRVADRLGLREIGWIWQLRPPTTT